MSKFKIGDKVVWCPHTTRCSFQKSGEAATIVELDWEVVVLRYDNLISATTENPIVIMKGASYLDECVDASTCDKCKYRLDRLITGRCPIDKAFEKP